MVEAPTPLAPRAVGSPETDYARERGYDGCLCGPRFNSGRVHCLIVSKNFVWFHVPKTGGTWVRRTIGHLGDKPAQGHGHWFPHPSKTAWSTAPWTVPYQEIPTTKAKLRLPRIFFVRDPWDYYVSLYCYWYDQFWLRRGACSPRDRRRWPPAAHRWARRFTEAGRDNFKGAVEDLLSSGFSQSGYHRIIKRGASRVEVGRFESLRTETVRLFGCSGTSKKVNTSRRRVSYRPYYDDRLRDRVGEVERWIIDQYGYAWAESPRARPSG